MGDKEDIEELGLDRFTPSTSKSSNTNKASSKRIAMFMFFGAGALFILVTMAIMGSEQIVRSGQPPQDVVRPASAASGIIPPISLRQPDPEPEDEEDLTVSPALAQAQQEQNYPTPIPVVIPQQTVPPVRRSVVRAYGRRQSMPFVSQTRKDTQVQRMQAAMSQTSVSSFASNSNPAASTTPLAGVDAVDASLMGSGSSGSSMMDMDMGMSSGASTVTAMTDPNGWSRKDAFTQQSLPQEYSRHSVLSPRSDFEIKAGTVIPSVLISGLNSDLPGNAIAQVSENVWDTATGRFLLIPRGSRLVGTYDNQITYGQNRALVIWSRLIFPDGTSITLDNLKGADQSGYAGFKGQVNRHLNSLITSSIFVSLIGAGVELAEWKSNSSSNNDSNRNIGNVFAERVATSIGEALTQIIQREIQRQPTIKVKPGYRFMIMVQHDIIFPKVWKP